MSVNKAEYLVLDLKNSNSGATHITTKNNLNIPGLGISSLLRNVTYI